MGKTTLATALRRRARSSTLCLAVLVLVGFTLISTYPATNEGELFTVTELDHDGSPVDPTDIVTVTYGRGRLMRYLDMLSTLRPKKGGRLADLFSKSGNHNFGLVDAFPLVPPKLQDLSRDEHAIDNDTGLLTVNPKGVHPLFQLITDAERQWEQKRERASKTLDDAVEEYKRRYKRLPPRGFDAWWAYVQKYNVQLPDEYDMIHDDLEIFWAHKPSDLRKWQHERESERNMFTIGKENEEDNVAMLNLTIPDGMDAFKEMVTRDGAEAAIELLKEVGEKIPPFRASVFYDDRPGSVRDWEWKDNAMKAIQEGRTLERAPNEDGSQGRSGWRSACPPDSPLGKLPKDDRRGVASNPSHSSTQKSFIVDHKKAMDPCYQPDFIRLHSQFLSYEEVGTQRFRGPSFAFSAMTLNSDIHTTSMAQTAGIFPEERDVPFEERDDDRLFWRGSPTGMHSSKNFRDDGDRWRYTQRLRLVNWTSADAPYNPGINDRVEYLRTPRETKDGRHEPVGLTRSMPRRKLNRALMDISFAGEPINCDQDVCEEMAKEAAFGPKVKSGRGGSGQYKYMLDVDGNGWSQRFRRLMGMDGVVLKSTIYPEWWLDRVQPWVHYVPVQVDYSDIYDILMFFSGDPSGEGGHDNMARSIARAGKEWARDFWRTEDATAYMFRLWLEYARVMSDERDTATYPPSS